MTRPKVKLKVNPGVKITLDKERMLKLDLNAMVAFEEVTGKSFMDGAFTNVVKVTSRTVGIGNGAVNEFNLANIPIEGSLKLFVNSILQVEDTDFTISEEIITFTEAPGNEAKITAEYTYQGNMTPRDLRIILWACLIHEDDTLTEKQVGSWVTMNNLLAITSKLNEAFEVAMPESEGKEKGPLAEALPSG